MPEGPTIEGVYLLGGKDEDGNIRIVRVNSDGEIAGGGGGGGVSDHGALTGLADNDHPQYRLASTPISLPSDRAVGDGGGDHSTGSTSLVDIDADYELSVPAADGDVLLIHGVMSAYSFPGVGRMTLALDVGGTIVDDILTENLGHSEGDNFSLAFTIQHVVTSGQISGGAVSIMPQYRVSAAVGNITNSGDAVPRFGVVNLRQ